MKTQCACSNVLGPREEAQRCATCPNRTTDPFAHLASLNAPMAAPAAPWKPGDYEHKFRMSRAPRPVHSGPFSADHPDHDTRCTATYCVEHDPYVRRPLGYVDLEQQPTTASPCATCGQPNDYARRTEIAFLQRSLADRNVTIRDLKSQVKNLRIALARQAEKRGGA